MRLYHYTAPTSTHLGGILTDRRIWPCESNVHPDGSGPPVVWLTDQDAPPNGRVFDWTGGGNAELKSLVRLTVEVPDAVPWSEWSREQGIDEAWYAVLDQAGGGESDHWFVLPRSVGASEITQIWFSDINVVHNEVPCPFVGRHVEGDDLKALWTSAARRRNLGLIPTKVPPGTRTLARL